MSVVRFRPWAPFLYRFIIQLTQLGIRASVWPHRRRHCDVLIVMNGNQSRFVSSVGAVSNPYARGLLHKRYILSPLCPLNRLAQPMVSRALMINGGYRGGERALGVHHSEVPFRQKYLAQRSELGGHSTYWGEGDFPETTWQNMVPRMPNAQVVGNCEIPEHQSRNLSLASVTCFRQCCSVSRDNSTFVCTNEWASKPRAG